MSILARRRQPTTIRRSRRNRRHSVPPTRVSWPESTRGVMDVLMKFLGMHVTGGSSSVPDAYQKLRTAGAVARETLKKAASDKTGVPVSRLKTARGAVQLPDGTELTYVELAPIAATIAPVTNVQLRDPSEWRLIGKPTQRHDIVAKSTGTLPYGVDFKIDGMLNATVKLNPASGRSSQRLRRQCRRKDARLSRRSCLLRAVSG